MHHNARGGHEHPKVSEHQTKCALPRRRSRETTAVYVHNISHLITTILFIRINSKTKDPVLYQEQAVERFLEMFLDELAKIQVVFRYPAKLPTATMI